MMAWCDAARLFGKTQTHSGRPWPNKPCPLRMNVSVSHAWLWLWIPPSYLNLKFRHSDIQQGLAKRPKRKCGGQILAITPKNPTTPHPHHRSTKMQVATNCYARRTECPMNARKTSDPKTGSTDISNTHSIRSNKISFEHTRSKSEIRFRYTCVFGIASHTANQTENESADTQRPRIGEYLEIQSNRSGKCPLLSSQNYL